MDDEYAEGVWIKERPYGDKQLKFKFVGNLIMLSGQSLDQVGKVLIETGHKDFPKHGHWLVATEPNGYEMHLTKDMFVIER